MIVAPNGRGFVHVNDARSAVLDAWLQSKTPSH